MNKIVLYAVKRKGKKDDAIIAYLICLSFVNVVYNIHVSRSIKPYLRRKDIYIYIYI